jgi:hypothetical protein
MVGEQGALERLSRSIPALVVHLVEDLLEDHLALQLPS